jgi:hypothetical protein
MRPDSDAPHRSRAQAARGAGTLSRRRPARAHQGHRRHLPVHGHGLAINLLLSAVARLLERVRHEAADLVRVGEAIEQRGELLIALACGTAFPGTSGARCEPHLHRSVCARQRSPARHSRHTHCSWRCARAGASWPETCSCWSWERSSCRGQVRGVPVWRWRPRALGSSGYALHRLSSGGGGARDAAPVPPAVSQPQALQYAVGRSCPRGRGASWDPHNERARAGSDLLNALGFTWAAGPGRGDPAGRQPAALTACLVFKSHAVLGPTDHTEAPAHPRPPPIRLLYSSSTLGSARPPTKTGALLRLAGAAQ